MVKFKMKLIYVSLPILSLASFIFVTYNRQNQMITTKPIFYSHAETKEGEQFSIRSHFRRDLYKNVRPDFTIDATCTLPYVSRACYNLIADYVYDEKVKNVEPVDKLKSGDVIMVSTTQCGEFFRKIFPQIKCFIILISHNSDYPLDVKYMKYLDDKKLVAWFASNPGFHHSKLVTLPIGFEDTNWFPNATKIKFMRNVKLDALTPWQKRKHLVYINFKTGTGIRRKARGHLKEFFKNFSNVFIEGRTTGSNIDYPTYLQRLDESKYVLCPRGNGLDTHRFYEAILMGSIPIVESSLLDPIFKETTSLLVNDFKEVTPYILQNPHQFIQDMSFSKKILFFDTWLQRIDSFKLKNIEKILY